MSASTIAFPTTEREQPFQTPPRVPSCGMPASPSVSVKLEPSTDEVDPAVAKRRLQYRQYQQRYRERQHQKTLALQEQVGILKQDVARLEQTLQLAQVPQDGEFASRGTLSGVPAQLMWEYIHRFQHGYSHVSRESQEQFVKSAMASDVRGPDFCGPDALIEQWRLYDSFFHAIQLTTQQIEVETMDDLTVVVARVTQTVRPRREGITLLYPNLSGREGLIQQLISAPIVAEGTLRFLCEVSGRVTWLGAEMDYVGAFLQALGSLDEVALCMEDANMSFCTGFITPMGDIDVEGQKAECTRGGDPAVKAGHHDLSFILCGGGSADATRTV